MPLSGADEAIWRTNMHASLNAKSPPISNIGQEKATEKKKGVVAYRLQPPAHLHE